MKKTIILFLLIIFFLHLIFRIFTYRDEYLRKYDPVFWKKRYNESQWVDPKSKKPIGDDGLYAYKGWKQIQGVDPTLLNPEVPPLGKYILGFSILIFGNQNIFALLSGALALISLFFLNKQFVKSKVFAFLPVVLFSFEPLFYTQLRAPYFDLLYLSFLLLTFLFFLRKKYLISGIFMGFMVATKSSITTIPIILTTFLGYSLLLRDRKLLTKSIMVSAIAATVFTATYLRFFTLGHSIINFLGVQKYIFTFYSIGAKGVPGDVLSVILTGYWHTWWGETIHVQEWIFTWPVIFLLSFIYIIQYIYKRKFDNFVLIIVWVIVYLLFLLMIPVFPRYLLLLLPFMYNLTVWFLAKYVFPRF